MPYRNRKSCKLILLYINSIYSHHMPLFFAQNRTEALSTACIFIIILSKQRRYIV